MAATLNYQFLVAAPPQTTFEMLVNPEFLQEKIGLADSGHFEVSGTFPELRLFISRKVDTDLPQMVRKFVGENLVVDEVQNWHKTAQNSYHAQLALKIASAPVQISGEITLAGSEITTVTIQAQIKVNVPIFGAAAEPHVVDTIKKVLADEEALCKNWISR